MITPEQYAQAVRDALADHPEREELLEDLDDHLAEIAAESDAPLEERLGSPAAYAEELVAAYGGRPESGRKPRRRAKERIATLHSRLLRQAPYRGFTGFLPELRPGWWVLRGYLVAMVLLSVAIDPRLVPGTLTDWVVVAVCVWASVWLGRRSKGRLAATTAFAVNLAAVLALAAGFVAAQPVESSEPVSYAVADAPVIVQNMARSDGFYNIKPYAKDGTPLADVYLYDQDGNPIITRPEEHGYMVDRSCGEPILNRYPLPLVEAAPEAQTAAPCPSPSPSATK
ncbi:hypothetical protein ACQP2T_08010 [Nonomuraea sp. CA-143628]|uniref:hypothetical protein n=1 Tax=Nonomuraea sp. CA-143628 TaxID=3239997 RepID=UPI003D909020